MSTIKFEQSLQDYENVLIQSYSSNSLSELDFAIASTISFDTLTIELTDPNRVPPSNQTIYLSDIIDNINTNTVLEYSTSTIETVIEDLSHSIVSTIEFSTDTTFISSLGANSIVSTIAVGQPKLNFIIDYPSIEPTVQFGGFTQLNMEIDPVPLPEMASTLVIPDPSVRFVIGPLGIASTESLGVGNIIDNIHRLLAFKDDNISKIGENDAAVIAGGIRLNPASTTSNTATSGDGTLPEAPVGFMSVNIGGRDYKIPYYNS